MASKTPLTPPSWSVTRGKARLLLASLLLLQILISLPRLNKPFLEGRDLWNYDGATFLLKAIHSQDRELPSRLGIFGLKSYTYDPEGAVEGFTHYFHHPTLPSLLFNAYTRVLGFHHWAPRTYALLFSLLTTVVIFFLLRSALGDEGLAAAFTLLYIVLPLNFNYQDAWKHENVAALFVWLCFLCLHHMDKARPYRLAFLAAFFLLFQTGWVAYPVAAGMLLYIFHRSRDRGDLSLAWQALAAALIGIAVNLLILHALGATMENMQGQALGRMTGRMESVSLRDWAMRQAGFLDSNFTSLNVFLALSLLAARAVRGRAASHALTTFGAITLAGTLAYITVFRNQSHTHHYVQWLAGTGILLVFAGAYGALREEGSVRPQRLLIGAFAVVVALLAVSVHGSRRMEAHIHGKSFASAKDIAGIITQKRRLVVSWDGSSGPESWWATSALSLYTDPFYKAWLLGHPLARGTGGLVSLDQPGRPVTLKPGSDVVVALNDAGAIRHMEVRLAERFGLGCLRLASATPAFAFLIPAAGADCKGKAAGPPAVPKRP
ncbi:MAG: glycosyltransferase family 39 protein [Elusimicrobia bacterium]|nr:glycosyltransferase family 39 protein [Elusimicrobiota bacterium]